MIALTLALALALALAPAHVAEARTFGSSSGTPVSSGGPYLEQDPDNIGFLKMFGIIFGSIFTLLAFAAIYGCLSRRMRTVYPEPAGEEDQSN
jgi:hypothetical protein